MDKVLKAAVRSLSSGSASFDSVEESLLPDVANQISLESILPSLDQDDSSAQSRLLEEESLYKLIYSSSILKQKGSSRILDELSKELRRKDIGPNSLRVSLGILSHIHIKPQKLGPFISSTLLPALIQILQVRKDENLLCAVSDHVDPLMRVFGPYALSKEVENFISVIIEQLLNGGEDQTPSQRRSISVCLCAISSHNKVRSYFISWAFCRLITQYCGLLRSNESTLLGLFAGARAFIPLLRDIESTYNVLQDTELEKCLFTLYEISIGNLEGTTNSHSLISANLELLHQIFRTPPLSLRIKLLSTQGFSERLLVDPPDYLQEKELNLSLEENVTEGASLPDENSGESSEDPLTEKRSEPLEKDGNDEGGGILGSYTDKDIPLVYAGRLIVSKTLLTPLKGVPRSDVRISIRCLAISCMSSIVTLSPKVFLLTLYLDQDEEDFESTPLLRDIASKEHFVLHSDPQLSGATALLLGHVLRGCLLETGGNGVDFWFNQRRPDHEDILAIFNDLLSQPDISSIALKHGLIAIRSFISNLLRSSLARQASLLLFEVVSDSHSLWKNSYWLVKTALLDLLSSVDYKLVHFVVDGSPQKKFFFILNSLLSDEDARVRSSASEALLNAVHNLYYPNDWADDECRESASRCPKTSFERVTHRIGDWLWGLIASADNNYTLAGGLEAYWTLKRGGHRVLEATDVSILDLVAHYVINSNFTLDIGHHILSLNVILSSLTVGTSASKADVFRHCVRVLNMIHHFVEDPTLHTQPSSSKKEEEAAAAVNESNSPLGAFTNSPHYLKLFQSLKNIYATYVSSSPGSKNDPSNKFNQLLSSMLNTLKSLLSLRCIGSCEEELAKEVLRYLSSIMFLDPSNTLTCVQSLLSYIFKTNDEGPSSGGDAPYEQRSGLSFYMYAFETPYEEFLSSFQLPKAKLCSSISFFDDKVNVRLRLSSSFLKRALSLKNWNREALTSYIRLFEPIVIQALQFYTMTSRAGDQSQVLSLLIQLVKLRVNYCLLDSDKVFVGYVLRHLEYIKDGNVTDAGLIMPKIFQFLVLLSVDKFHSKVVVPVDDIVTLLTDLSSSNVHIIPAVCPVVEVLFGNWTDAQGTSSSAGVDLEATREKLFKLLLNYMHYPEILDVFVSKLCFVKSEGEDRWRKVSRILFDHILALLSTQKIRLRDSSSLRTLYSFFLCLAPGTLRPVDALLSSVLTSAVDLGSVVDVQRWLGFVVVSLCVITNQSPEEGILSRLEEFGLISAKPEVTFAKFLFQVIGASLSKLHQMVYSLVEEESSLFLEEEVSMLLNLVVYVLKSDRFCRVSRAAQLIAEDEEDGLLLYSLDFIDNIAYELSHAYPYVTLRWNWILTLLKRVKTPYWSKIISSHLLSSLDKAILQKGSLILLCQYLCETNPMEEVNVELVTWLLSNFSHLIVESMQVEEPIWAFVQSVHAKASLSGLFLQAIISRCMHRMSSSVLFQKRALAALEQVHESHSSNLLMFLIERVAPKAHLSLSGRIQGMCCKIVERILGSGSPRELLSAEELSEAIGHMQQSKSIKRYGRLVALLNELASEWYPEAHVHVLEATSEGRQVAFSPSSLLKPDKPWFLAQLKSKCSLREPPQDTEQCAKMLTWLRTQEDISSIIASPDFNIAILESLFKDPSTPLLLTKTSKDVFFGYHLKKFTEKYLLLHSQPLVYGPNDWASSGAEARYKDQLESHFASKPFRETLLKSLSIIPLIPVKLYNYETDTETLKRIPFLLSLEFAKWLYFYCTEPDVKGREEIHHVAFKALGYVFRNPSITYNITNEEAVLGVHALFSVLCGDEDVSLSKTPACPRYKEVVLAERGSKNSILLAALKINRLLTSVVLNKDGDRLWNRKDLRGPIGDVILGLARLPCFNSYVSIPLEIWRQGWNDGVPFGPHETKFPLISVDHLMEIDVLREYSIRVNAIGWSDRPQFEETWMSLLGIFSILQDDMSDSDIYFLGHCSSLVVRTATNLLLKTLGIPHPGLSNASKLLSHSRLSPCEFMASSSRGKALVSLQSRMHELLSRFAPSEGVLSVYGAVNLENMSSSGYGSGQVSVSYILSAINYYEGEAFENSNNATTNERFRQREEALVNSGLDIDSCLHFLFDLYSSWFKNPRSVPLVLLTEAIRSILALSDIFTTKRSFQWMYSHFIDLVKSHPSDDEILTSLLRVGICKALAILGPSPLFKSEHTSGEPGLSFDGFMRLLENGYVSSYLPAQISTLQGTLYILQRRDLFSDSNALLFNYLVRSSVEYLTNNLFYLTSPVHEGHGALCWSLTFYILENYDNLVSELPWTANVLQLALSTPGKDSTSSGVYLAILSGFERLLLGGKLSKTFPGSGIRAQDQVIKLATDLLTESNPLLGIPSIQLYLSSMYMGGYPHLPADPPSTPERLMHAMEQISILFDCIRRSGPTEASFLCQILPPILVDFFPAADVINRVISEFISPGQPHQPLLAGVMFSVFNQASGEHCSMLQDWVLSILPTFTKRSPISHSTWCMSCFFLSVPPPQPDQEAAPDTWLQALFPHLQTRLGSFTSEDKKLFCLVAKEFYSHLTKESQREKFLAAFKEVAHPKTPYYDLLQVI